MMDVVTVELHRDHQVDPRTKSICHCGRNVFHPAHGSVSFNRFGSGANRWTYQTAKKLHTAAWHDQLEASGLPRDLDGVTVDGRIWFPDRHERDLCNYRYFLEKILGDTLQAGGWLRSDSWYPTLRFEMGGLEAFHDPGHDRVQLLLMPR